MALFNLSTCFSASKLSGESHNQDIVVHPNFLCLRIDLLQNICINLPGAYQLRLRCQHPEFGPTHVAEIFEHPQVSDAVIGNGSIHNQGLEFRSKLFYIEYERQSIPLGDIVTFKADSTSNWNLQLELWFFAAKRFRSNVHVVDLSAMRKVGSISFANSCANALLHSSIVLQTPYPFLTKLFLSWGARQNIHIQLEAGKILQWHRDSLLQRIQQSMQGRVLEQELIYSNRRTAMSTHENHRQNELSVILSSKRRLVTVTEAPRSAVAFTEYDDSHFIVYVHGLDGSATDFRHYRNLYHFHPTARKPKHVLAAKSNENDSYASIRIQGKLLAAEVEHWINSSPGPLKRLSFVCHSLGALVARQALLSMPQDICDHLYQFISFGGPHAGMWFNQNQFLGFLMLAATCIWPASRALIELEMRDHVDPRKTLLYQLNTHPGLSWFRHVVLVACADDHYVPFQSARLEFIEDYDSDGDRGIVYREMIRAQLTHMDSTKTVLDRVSVRFPSATRTAVNSLLGREGHLRMIQDVDFLEILQTLVQSTPDPKALFPKSRRE